MTVDLETRVRQANPLTRDDQLEQLFGDDASIRLLRAVHDRKEDRMTEQRHTEQPPTVVPDEPNALRRLGTRINPEIAIGAFLVVIAVGIALAIAFRESEPDAVSPQSLAASYIEAQDRHDTEAASALIAADATIDELATTAEERAGLFELHRVLDWRWTVEECSETPAGPAVAVTCSYTHSNLWTRAMDMGPITGSFDFVIADGQIVELAHNFNIADYTRAWEAFNNWVSLHHFADLGVIYNADGEMLYTAEALELIAKYTEEFVAEQSGEQ